MKRIVCVVLVGVCVAMLIAGCSPRLASEPVSKTFEIDEDAADRVDDAVEIYEGATVKDDDIVIIDEDATDQMYSEDVYGAEFFVFQIDGETYTVDDCYPVGLMQGNSLVDGRFYKVVADVTYLNGGLAGYVNFPEVRDVRSCKKVPAKALDLPSIEETPYGLVRIGDYAKGDILCNERNIKAVWIKGKWKWRYEDDAQLEDGTNVLLREGVDTATAQAGADAGVLACEDYFILPAQ